MQAGLHLMPAWAVLAVLAAATMAMWNLRRRRRLKHSRKFMEKLAKGL
jgi:Flp pilus assembly protein TadB